MSMMDQMTHCDTCGGMVDAVRKTCTALWSKVFWYSDAQRRIVGPGMIIDFLHDASHFYFIVEYQDQEIVLCEKALRSQAAYDAQPKPHAELTEVAP